MFLWVNLEEINTYFILPNLQSSSDHTLLMVDIIINEKFIQDKWQNIIKNSVKKECFVNELKNIVSNINTTNISHSKLLKRIIQELVAISENLWNKYSKYVKITKHSKVWWTKECSRKLNMYHSSKLSLDWKIFKEIIKRTKRSFFNEKI